MKFKFKLEALLKTRKAELDEAQRIFAAAQESVRKQMKMIQDLYEGIDRAREQMDIIQSNGGNCAAELDSINYFIDGQKIKIERERNKARELMMIEEEKLEILVGKNKAYKIIEKLKEKRVIEFKKALNKKRAKEIDDIITMRFNNKVGL